MNQEPNYVEAKIQSSQWAKERLSDPKTIIIDLETTGLLSKQPESEIVQISLINVWEKPLINMLVKPNFPIGWESINIHKIEPKMVNSSPTFEQIAPLLIGLISGKHLVSYNASFDIHFITHMFTKYGFEVPEFEVSCAMENFSKWQGEWSKSKGNWKWQKLPTLAYGEAHDSLVDCVSTLRLMRKMAGQNIFPEDLDLIDLNF